MESQPNFRTLLKSSEKNFIVKPTSSQAEYRDFCFEKKMGELGTCGGVCLGLIWLIALILYCISFETIDPLHSGLQQNSISKLVGTHFRTPTKSIYSFV